MRSVVMTGTYVRFQPRTADFQREVGDAVGEVLTAALFTHSVLTEGDWIQVMTWHADVSCGGALLTQR